MWDGWNAAVELNYQLSPIGYQLTRTYTWGLDLSDTLLGAGGAGGLIIEKDSSGEKYFPSYDGNGNLVNLIQADGGNIIVSYAYGPFGELLRTSGSPATNPIRFSSRYMDDETSFSYYGYRFYNATIGRWLSRDPIEEYGMANLYGFIQNNAMTGIDVLGLSKKEDIDSGGLIYSTNAGWIDWGHVNPSGARRLWGDVKSENGWTYKDGNDKYYVLYYQQSMSKLGLTASAGQHCHVKVGLSLETKKGVALGIFKAVSDDFEDMQASFPYSLVTNSGNSEEDRPSDLISFYRAVEGYTKQDIEGMAAVRSKEESKCLWDKIGGLKTSKSWSPTDYNSDLGEILGEHIDSMKWPAELSKIKEISPGGQHATWTLGY